MSHVKHKLSLLDQIKKGQTNDLVKLYTIDISLKKVTNEKKKIQNKIDTYIYNPKMNI